MVATGLAAYAALGCAGVEVGGVGCRADSALWSTGGCFLLVAEFLAAVALGVSEVGERSFQAALAGEKGDEDEAKVSYHLGELQQDCSGALALEEVCVVKPGRDLC